MPLNILVNVPLLRVRVAYHRRSHLILGSIVLGDTFFLTLFTDAVHGVEQGEVVWRVLVFADLDLVAAVRAGELVEADELADAGFAEGVSAALEHLGQPFTPVEVLEAKLTLHFSFLL